MRKHIFQGRVIDVGTEEVTLPSGVTVTLDVIRHPGAALVVPLDGDRVTMIRQYRHCAGGWLWECPAGTLNAGEEPVDCARRELSEEAGLQAKELHYAGFVFNAPGYADEKIHIFVATGLSPLAGERDHDEVITEVRAFSFDDCEAMVARNEITDAKTVAALFHARRFVVPD